jgi:hypothetical protein
MVITESSYRDPEQPRRFHRGFSESIAVWTASTFLLLMQGISPSGAFLPMLPLCNHFPGKKRLYEAITNIIYSTKSLAEVYKRNIRIRRPELF